MSDRERMRNMLDSLDPPLVPCRCGRSACRKVHYDGEPEDWAVILEKVAHAKYVEAVLMFRDAATIRRMMDTETELLE